MLFLTFFRYSKTEMNKKDQSKTNQGLVALLCDLGKGMTQNFKTPIVCYLQKDAN
jgi:hypothetical protein